MIGWEWEGFASNARNARLAASACSLAARRVVTGQSLPLFHRVNGRRRRRRRFSLRDLRDKGVILRAITRNEREREGRSGAIRFDALSAAFWEILSAKDLVSHSSHRAEQLNPSPRGSPLWKSRNLASATLFSPHRWGEAVDMEEGGKPKKAARLSGGVSI